MSGLSVNGSVANESENVETYDLIVIGSGLGGLAAGAIQAKRGKRVLVVEKHKVLGGCASVFGRKGKTFDTSLHLLSGAQKTLVADILEDAGVAEKLRWLKPDNLCELQLGEGGEILAIPNGDIDGFQTMLEEKFPNEKWAIKRWFWFMRRFGRQATLDDKARRQNPVVQGMTLFFYPLLAPFLVISIAVTPKLSMALRVKDPMLRNILLHFSLYYGSPNNKINALFPMVANYNYYSDGGYYLEGGGYSIIRYLSMVIRKHGGKVITGHAARAIETSGNQVTGVRIADDETHYTTGEIICSANPFTVYRDMLSQHSIAQKELAKIRKMELSITCCILYLYIDVPIEQLNPDLKDTYEFFFVSTEREEDYYERFHNRHHFEDDYAKDPLALTFHSHLDTAALGDEGTGTLMDVFVCDNIERWRALSPEEYQEQKKRELDKIIAKVETVLPNIRHHIKIAELATPITVERYTSNEGGVIYGFSQKPSQSGIRHRFKIKSPLRGLHFVSAWTNPGGGYEGVLRAADNYTNPYKRVSLGICGALIAVSILAPYIIASFVH